MEEQAFKMRGDGGVLRRPEAEGRKGLCLHLQLGPPAWGSTHLLLGDASHSQAHHVACCTLRLRPASTRREGGSEAGRQGGRR